MSIIQVIAELKLAIDVACSGDSGLEWRAAAQKANLVSQGDKKSTGIDETYARQIGDVTISLRHRWYDTSGPFSPGPDRTRLELEIRYFDIVLDTYTNGYDD